MRKRSVLLSSFMLGASALSCGSGGEPRQAESESVGDVELSLTNTPTDVACLRVTVTGTSRNDSRKFPLNAGQNATFRLKGLPVGNASIAADAFALGCDQLANAVQPTWYSEPKGIAISAKVVTHVALKMIHNGQISLGVDFDERNGRPNAGDPPLTGGVFSSALSYVVPVAAGVKAKAILTVGDAAGTKPDGSPYRFVGIPDGAGAYDNGDGTFTLLVNHELGANSGIVRAHGARGAFVSKWTIRKADLAVLKGEDLIQQVVTWNPTTSSYNAPASGVAFGRFCSADLPAPTAFYDAATGLGFDGPIFMNGEESGAEGRGMAHAPDGVSYELPRTGKFSWENNVASPAAGVTTLVAGLDDSGGGQVYFYVGTKTGSGSPVDKAGLTNGSLYGLKVTGLPQEDPAVGIAAPASFTLHPFGNVENMTGAQLETLSNTNQVTKFARPEDGAWDPNNPDDFYFVTTNAFDAPSRLWRVRFVDAQNPTLGGTFELLLNGSEGQQMFDNIGIDLSGHVYLQEDVGGNAHLGKIWRYDIATDTQVVVATHDASRFDPSLGSPTFITQDEEASGIIDVSNILGPGWFIQTDQIHRSSPDPELVEGGQIQAIFDPASTP